MALILFACIGGLLILFWSAERFIEGASSAAHHARVPPLLIGMVVVGFGTSAPEMIVSALAAARGSAGLALGNAYGSSIANIALILGLAALLRPIDVHSRVLRAELPVLCLVTLIAALQLSDGRLSRADASILLLIFGLLLVWAIRYGLRRNHDTLAAQVDCGLAAPRMSRRRAVLWLPAGLVLLIVGSRILVWGATGLAQRLGIDDLVVGLTIVAVGTSLPELAATVAACCKQEHDIALGNIIGSNLFNTLAVAGLAGAIRPLRVPPQLLARDIPFLAVLTLSLFLIGYGFRGPGRVNRREGAALLVAYLAYVGWLIRSSSG